MNQPTITIACPIRNREWVLSHYLEHLLNIDYPRNLINLHFVINNSSDNSEKILNNFKSLHINEYNNITIDQFAKNRNVPEDKRTMNTRIDHIYSHLSDLRNYIFSKVKTDYLLSCDSDILVPTNILNKLLSADKKICAAVIYNGYIVYPEKYYNYPNALRLVLNGTKYEIEHVSNYYIKNSEKLTESKIIPIEITGAVSLIANEVCKNTKYGYHFLGEDIFWSLDCLSKGYQPFIDASVFCNHIMTEDLLQQYIESKNKVLI